MENTLFLLQKENSRQLVATANELIGAIDGYMNTFDKKELLSFLGSKERAKKYEENYFAFLLALSPIISEISRLGGELASLTIRSDNAISGETVAECEKRFNAFEKLEKELYEYTQNVENAFSSSKASAVFLLNSAQKLKNSVSEFINACA